MNFLTRAKLLFQFGFRPIRGATHAERLESFYGYQATHYDDYREKFLIGRREMVRQLNIQPGTQWLDIGCGTGYLLDCANESARQCERIVLVDMTPSLLSVARDRVKSDQWTNVEIIESDAVELKLETSFDYVTFSYSLTMIPDWFAAIDRAFELLKPGGKIGIADFFVAGKHAVDQATHSWLTRNYWRAFFDTDNVSPSQDHLPYLHHKFETVWLAQQRTRIPGMLFHRPPCYAFVGSKPSQ